MSEEKSRGRPSLFKEEFADQLIEYFGVKPYTSDGENLVANDPPTLAGFAIKLGVCRTTLHEWSVAKDEDGNLKHPEFSYAYGRAKDFQENYFIINGNRGLINPAFAMFTAKNVLGWRDKKPDEIDTLINNSNSVSLEKLTDEQLDARIKELEAKKAVTK